MGWDRVLCERYGVPRARWDPHIDNIIDMFLFLFFFSLPLPLPPLTLPFPPLSLPVLPSLPLFSPLFPRESQPTDNQQQTKYPTLNLIALSQPMYESIKPHWTCSGLLGLHNHNQLMDLVMVNRNILFPNTFT
jgi:hypothetical protein